MKHIEITKKTLIGFLLPGLIAFAIRLICGLLFNAISNVLVCPLLGIFAGIPGVIGSAVGSLISNVILGSDFASSLCYMIPTIVASLIPFLGARFLKDKSRFSNVWIYFAISFVTAIAMSLAWYLAYALTGNNLLFIKVFEIYSINLTCISFSIGYPVYFLISAIKERNFKTGNSLLNTYTCWLPLQYVCIIFFAIKVSSISTINNVDLLLVLDNWMVVNIYMLILGSFILLVATLAVRFKRAVILIFAAFFVAASVVNIIGFDTGEGLYVLIFIALWLILHGIFYNWYENKALKVKAVKIITIILHWLLIILFVLISALDASVYIIPQASGDENNVIVLGAPVNDNKASEILEERIALASDYLNLNENADAILTGGTKVEGGKTEAEVIRDGLVANGISESRLTLESGAKTTQENFEKSLEIIKEKGGSADDVVVIVTSSFHLLRSGIYALRAGFKELAYLGSNSHYFKDLSWYIRESLTILPLLFS